ncbi:MAG: hypothetical protein BJ554DRAFT_6359, partial [Olpidium bornovanus]
MLDQPTSPRRVHRALHCYDKCVGRSFGPGRRRAEETSLRQASRSPSVCRAPGCATASAVRPAASVKSRARAASAPANPRSVRHCDNGRGSSGRFPVPAGQPDTPPAGTQNAKNSPAAGFAPALIGTGEDHRWSEDLSAFGMSLPPDHDSDEGGNACLERPRGSGGVRPGVHGDGRDGPGSSAASFRRASRPEGVSKERTPPPRAPAVADRTGGVNGHQHASSAADRCVGDSSIRERPKPSVASRPVQGAIALTATPQRRPGDVLADSGAISAVAEHGERDHPRTNLSETVEQHLPLSAATTGHSSHSTERSAAQEDGQSSVRPGSSAANRLLDLETKTGRAKPIDITEPVFVAVPEKSPAGRFPPSPPGQLPASPSATEAGLTGELPKASRQCYRPVVSPAPMGASGQPASRTSTQRPRYSGSLPGGDLGPQTTTIGGSPRSLTWSPATRRGQLSKDSNIPRTFTGVMKSPKSASSLGEAHRLISRGGLDGDKSLINHDTQEELFSWIKDEVSTLASFRASCSAPTGNSEAERRRRACVLSDSMRKLREGILASRRVDSFAVEGEENAVVAGWDER